MDDAVTSNKFMILDAQHQNSSDSIIGNQIYFLYIFVSVRTGLGLSSFFQDSIIDANTKNEFWKALLFADFAFCQQRVTVGQRENIYC
jgi:hypothetical protein